MRKSIYGFLAAQEDQAKKLMLYKIDPMVNFSNYLKEVVHPAVKNDEYDIRTNTASKFFFHRFNSLRNTKSLHSYGIRHTKIWDDDFAVESLQSKNWQYCIERVLNFSENYNLLQQQLSEDINSSSNEDKELSDDTHENAAIF